MKCFFQRGLTLIELMVAVAILAILASLAAPNMADFIDRQRLVSQTEAIAELFQLARSEAIRHSSVGAIDQRSIAATIHYAAGANDWFIGLRRGNAACTGSAGTSPCVVNEGGNDVTRFVRNSECAGCTMTSPTADALLVFNFKGLVSAAADSAIVIRSPLGKQAQINVSRIGRISVCSPGGSITNYPSC